MKTLKNLSHLSKIFILCAGAGAMTFEARASSMLLGLSDSQFTIDTDSYSGNGFGSVIPSSTADGIVWNGSFAEADLFYGGFSGSPLNLSTFTGLNLILQLNSGVNPNIAFTVGLANSNGDAVFFSGTTEGLSGLNVTTLALTTNPGSFSFDDLTDVAGFQFIWDGGGTINAKILAAEAVPEPSSGSLLMLGAAGLVALRRLRKV